MHINYLLFFRAIQEAHEKIVEGLEGKSVWLAGTTTLCGGILMKVMQDKDPWLSEWGFICVNVGDCKAFLYSPKRTDESLKLTNKEGNTTTEIKVIDITEGNRPSLDPTSCGGRLGPQNPGALPDLSNMDIYFQPCQPGDIIMMVTDGVHDNLDPYHLGLPPTLYGLTKDNWDDVEDGLKLKVRDHSKSQILKQKLEGLNTPKDMTQRVLQHCLDVTKNSREYLEQSRGKKIPLDFVQFPGKMDHTTLLSVVV
eukprot:TRINITY_DN12888_c0_g1_i1.p1 TRINITY_DN12888_c0_g1~~TRINITY_DN12888_c0_g1_i1.p1  ORF type:complete len:253 (-),score=44.97 TRINITY_DN12888_c0_g1_i1:13-771(-)